MMYCSDIIFLNLSIFQSYPHPKEHFSCFNYESLEEGSSLCEPRNPENADHQRNAHIKVHNRTTNNFQIVTILPASAETCL